MTDRSDLTSAYFKALRLPPASARSKAGDPRKAALDRAHEMRKFEIENYWKRATYFWSFQAIAFAFLGFLLKEGRLPETVQILQLPASIGAVSAFIGYLSARGSKYWQENWESHVDMLEGQVEGRLTQTIWSDGKRSHSVSRLNQTFMLIITAWWVALMTCASCEGLRNSIGKLPPLLPFALLAATLLGVFWWTRQDFAGQIYRKSRWLEERPFGAWAWRRLGMPRDSRKVILRDTRAKDAEPPS